MQRRISSFKGYTIEATDGKVGFISDILFQDNNWDVRWFVIDTGPWLLGRKILIHPSSLGRPDVRLQAFSVTLTKVQVEASPEIGSDEPVSRQMDHNVSNYYGYEPMWGGGFEGGDGFGMSGGSPSINGWQNQEPSQPGDKHLRSIAEVLGYHIHALDGDIGHLDDFLVNDESWKLEFIVVDTKNWGFGNHVLVSPAEVKEIDWANRYVHVALTRYKIKSSPSWKEPDWSDLPGA